jgi:hypothetical protein
MRMGREIRRVPPDWQHPKSERYPDRYEPLYDKDFPTAARKWMDDALAWENGTHEDLVRDPTMKERFPFFWQWEGDPPGETSYRPAWPSGSQTHYQVYETVSEGTPVSPVFATEDEVVRWLVGQGHSEHAARAFVSNGWAPSGTMHVSSAGVEYKSNVDVYDMISGPTDRGDHREG